MTVLAVAAYIVAVAAASLRWLRIAQREHYQAGRVSRFALRWWRSSSANLWLAAAAVAGSVAAVVLDGSLALAATGVTLTALAAAPLGLGLRGRTSPLRWTRRLRVLFAVTVMAMGGLGAVAALTGAVGWLGVIAVVHPVVIDMALAVTGPIERLSNERFVRSARQVLDRIDPLVIGITGSYGKTTVKNYIAHVLRRSKKTVASRASFNNRLGLARSINEDLGLGTEVFVAEMGTYGPGEIRELCGWLRPTVGVITGIGPVHLERMGSIDNIVAAKAEILADVEVAVLNIDSNEIRTLANDWERRGRRLIRCSEQDPDADVVVRWHDGELDARVGDRREVVAAPPIELVPINVALALGVAFAVDALPSRLGEVLSDLAAVPNRLTILRDEGLTVIDDTYNSNPAGARRALAALEKVADGHGGRAVVVTPGMVELGARQSAENRAFAEAASRIATDVVVVGQTNRRDLIDALTGTKSTNTVAVTNREEAVAWIHKNLKPGDAVLFENDLPDHYP
ncbi:MAG: Mur ligase family protein [Egibacteraceae bacterium]